MSLIAVFETSDRRRTRGALCISKTSAAVCQVCPRWAGGAVLPGVWRMNRPSRRGAFSIYGRRICTRSFRSLFVYSSTGKKGGIQLISVSEVAAKGEFNWKKNQTREKCVGEVADTTVVDVDSVAEC